MAAWDGSYKGQHQNGGGMGLQGGEELRVGIWGSKRLLLRLCSHGCPPARGGVIVVLREELISLRRRGERGGCRDKG